MNAGFADTGCADGDIPVKGSVVVVVVGAGVVLVVGVVVVVVVGGDAVNDQVTAAVCVYGWSVTHPVAMLLALIEPAAPSTPFATRGNGSIGAPGPEITNGTCGPAGQTTVLQTMTPSSLIPHANAAVPGVVPRSTTPVPADQRMA